MWCGALGMAKNGDNYQRILLHYYNQDQDQQQSHKSAVHARRNISALERIYSNWISMISTMSYRLS
jgi:peptidoglycan hydrolase-like amidase